MGCDLKNRGCIEVRLRMAGRVGWSFWGEELSHTAGIVGGNGEPPGARCRVEERRAAGVKRWNVRLWPVEQLTCDLFRTSSQKAFEGLQAVLAQLVAVLIAVFVGSSTEDGQERHQLLEVSSDTVAGMPRDGANALNIRPGNGRVRTRVRGQLMDQSFHQLVEQTVRARCCEVPVGQAGCTMLVDFTVEFLRLISQPTGVSRIVRSIRMICQLPGNRSWSLRTPYPIEVMARFRTASRGLRNCGRRASRMEAW